MRRRKLLALLGGALGAGLAGCSDLVEDDDSEWNGSDWNDSEWNGSDWNDSEWNGSDWNDSEWNDSNLTGGFNETEFELCSGTAEGIEIVNHTLGPGPNETYYVEGSVRNDGSDTRCSYVLLQVVYPDERRETDSLFTGDLEPGETGYFILGPIDLSDADHDPERYNIYVTNESWDDD